MPVAFDAYADNRDTRSLPCYRQATRRDGGGGMIAHQAQARDQRSPAWAFGHARRACGEPPEARRSSGSPGLSGAGKSTIANLVERSYTRAACLRRLLDGDNVRHGLNRDLGFTDRTGSRTSAGSARWRRLMTDAGRLICAPSSRRSADGDGRDPVPEGEFIEIFVDTPLEARSGRSRAVSAGRRDRELHQHRPALREAPEAPELILDSAAETPEALADIPCRA